MFIYKGQSETPGPISSSERSSNRFKCVSACASIIALSVVFGPFLSLVLAHKVEKKSVFTICFSIMRHDHFLCWLVLRWI